MRRRLCDKLHRRLSQLLLARPAAAAIRPESLFVPTPPAFDVPVRALRRTIAMTFGKEKT